MPNRNLDPDELKRANLLLDEIRTKIDALASGDSLLKFAYRRKIYKELVYDERGKPMARRQLKLLKWGLQKGKCAHCDLDMELAYSELDRQNAVEGYSLENTELIHANCHRIRQAAKAYT